MSVTDTLAKLEDQVVETLESIQDPVVDLAANVAGAVEARLPEVDAPTLPADAPTAREMVDTSFDFARRVLDNQQRFVEAILDATQPLADRVVTEAPASSPSV